MAKSFLVSAAKVGTVLENNTAALSGTNITGVGCLYDSADQTYEIIADNTDVAIDAFGLEHETFQDNEDHYDHMVDLRYIGSGNVTTVAIDDTATGAGTLDAANLIHAATFVPNGGNSLTGDLLWNPADDTAAGTKASDLRGYAVIVEKKTAGGKFVQWTFHNARIEATPSFATKQSTRLNFRWADARLIDFAVSATTFTNHSDA